MVRGVQRQHDVFSDRAESGGNRDFHGRSLRGRSFYGEDLQGADFRDADLRGADFSRARRARAGFRITGTAR